MDLTIQKPIIELLLSLIRILEKRQDDTCVHSSYTLVFKPIYGIGCEGLSIVKKENEVLGAINKIKRNSMESKFIVQKIIKGKHASVSLFSNGKE